MSNSVILVTMALISVFLITSGILALYLQCYDLKFTLTNSVVFLNLLSNFQRQQFYHQVLFFHEISCLWW